MYELSTCTCVDKSIRRTVDKGCTRGVQILMQLGKCLVFNHELHEIDTCIV